jgi:hypothetical protein
MLRISQTVSNPTTTIHLEGKLLAAWVGELDRVVADASARGEVCLNLATLSFADAIGIQRLRELHARGVKLIGYSDFVADLLRVAPCQLRPQHHQM